MRFAARSTVVRIGAGAMTLSLLAGGAVVAQAALTRVPSEVQAGDYRLDPAWASMICPSLSCSR